MVFKLCSTVRRHVVSAAATTLVAVAFLRAPRAEADVIFDNLYTPDSAAPVSDGQWFAQSFKVGLSDMILTSVELNIFGVDPAEPLGPPQAGNFFVSLYASGIEPEYGNYPSPNSLQEIFIGSDNPHAPGIYTYAGSSLLTANTSYWIVAGGGNYSLFGVYWWFSELADSAIEVGEPGDFGPYDITDDFVILEPYILNQDLHFNIVPNPFWYGNVGSMRLNGNPIAEPSGLTLAALAAGAALVARRKRQTANGR